MITHRTLEVTCQSLDLTVRLGPFGYDDLTGLLPLEESLVLHQTRLRPRREDLKSEYLTPDPDVLLSAEQCGRYAELHETFGIYIPNPEAEQSYSRQESCAEPTGAHVTALNPKAPTASWILVGEVTLGKLSIPGDEGDKGDKDTSNSASEVSIQLFDASRLRRGIGLVALLGIIKDTFSSSSPLPHMIQAQLSSENNPAKQLFQKMGFTEPSIAETGVEFVGGYESSLKVCYLLNSAAVGNYTTLTSHPDYDPETASELLAGMARYEEAVRGITVRDITTTLQREEM